MTSCALPLAVLLLGCAVPGVVVAGASVPDDAGPGAFIAAVRGEVRVERGGGTVRAAFGMALRPGDRVVVAEGGEAVVYSDGADLLRVASGGSLPIDGGAEAISEDGPVRRIGATATPKAESGLRALLEPMTRESRESRGAADAEPSDSPTPLSPRHERVTVFDPVFHAAGRVPPVRVALATETTVIWRSGSLESEGPWTPEGFPRLDPRRTFLWRLESLADGTPLTEWVPIRGATERVLLEVHNFEIDMDRLAKEPMGASVADLLRCGLYAELGAWTPLLGASSRLLATHPDAEIALAARARAVDGLALDAARLAELERRLLGESEPTR